MHDEAIAELQEQIEWHKTRRHEKLEEKRINWMEMMINCNPVTILIFVFAIAYCNLLT